MEVPLIAGLLGEHLDLLSAKSAVLPLPLAQQLLVEPHIPAADNLDMDTDSIASSMDADIRTVAGYVRNHNCTDTDSYSYNPHTDRTDCSYDGTR